ncbi:MAG TPA: FAD binding domain-containing protein [Candidatus Acidoferrales bacterium]|nr:FAD binding domain-containing protein [Candidatus Acidoferrales bacterium]
MMVLRRFEIHQPKDVAEACEMLAHYGEKGRLYAGGTELLLAMKHNLLRYDHLVDIKVVRGLDRIEPSDSKLVIGATVTHRAIEKSSVVRERIPVLAEMEARVANVRVRATGTLGGNLCFAEPHSDPAALLLALGARLQIQGKSASRTVAMNEFIVGPYETCLAPDEVLTAVEIPVPAPSARAAYLKFQIHERPTLGLALVLDTEDNGETIRSARAVVGSVCLTPSRSDKADALLVGPRSQVERQLGDAAEILADEADLADDLEGGADYKRHLIGVFLKRAFLKALSR